MPQGKISGVNEVHKWSELLETLIQLLTSIVLLKQLGLERELIKVQANLDAEMNMRNQANTAKADLESE